MQTIGGMSISGMSPDLAIAIAVSEVIIDAFMVRYETIAQPISRQIRGV